MAAPGFEKELVDELRDVGAGEPVGVYGRLVVARGEARPVAWAHNVWLAPERIDIESIGDAARKLSSRGPSMSWMEKAMATMVACPGSKPPM